MTHRKAGRKDFYLSYNLSGPMTVYLKGREHVLRPGSFFWYRPFEEQLYGHRLEKEYLAYWVHFTGYGVEELLNQVGLLENNAFFAGFDDRIVSLFGEMMDELRDKQAGYELASSSHLSYLFSLISRQLDREVNAKGGHVRNEIYESIKYIHQHYAEEIYVNRLAEISHLSTDRYTALFKRLTATTPNRYIIRFRLQRSRELMKHTSLNIQQIANMVGFEDQLYFSRMFKKHYHKTPSEYLSDLGRQS
ncbi:helix-turn-helix domain-containing protein [Cohnella suwonensis]|uniref:Helix-turn-helix domain-containing protein n=1 Tax=Cohnella suwonensis TaxID=696072 RepID=A0ABW0LRJ8_9BACL